MAKSQQLQQEHTPGPQFHRAIYGFSFYLIFHTLFLIYVVWAFVPDTILADVFHLNYLPDKYFALYIPVLILNGTALFAFLVYPTVNMRLTPKMDSLSTIRDKFTIRRCAKENCTSPRKMSSKNVTGTASKWCKRHDAGEDELFDEELISNWCDCGDEAQCLIRTCPDQVERLRRKKKMPTVCDLDLADVSDLLYG